MFLDTFNILHNLKYAREIFVEISAVLKWCVHIRVTQINKKFVIF